MNSINISDDILNQVMQTSGLSDKTQAVTFALQSFITKNSQKPDDAPVRFDMQRMQQAIDSAKNNHQTLTSNDKHSVDSIRQAIIDFAND